MDIFIPTNKLVWKINKKASKRKHLSQDEIMQLYWDYNRMFQQRCTAVPNFEIVSSRGHIKLLWSVG